MGMERVRQRVLSHMRGVVSALSVAVMLVATLPTMTAHGQNNPSRRGMTEASGSMTVTPVKHDSPWRICRDFVGSDASRWCRVTRLPFAAHGPFHSLWELRHFDGRATSSTLAVAGPEGVATASFHYRADNPDDPGCMSVLRPMGLSRAYLEGDHLVLISVTETGGWTPPDPNDPIDTGYRASLVRTVVILSWVEGGLETRDYTQWGAPTFGIKSNPAYGTRVAWASIPWQDQTRPLIVDGRLMRLH